MGKKKYTKEQKAKVVALLTLGEKKSSEIAKETGVNASTVRYIKANLKKVQEKDGSLGYHFAKQKNLVNKAYTAAEITIDKIIKGLKIVEPKTPGQIKDMASVLGTLLNRIEKATPRPQLPPGEKLSLPDTSDWSVEELKIAHIKLKKIIESSAPQLEGGEVIDGEFRGIN